MVCGEIQINRENRLAGTFSDGIAGMINKTDRARATNYYSAPTCVTARHLVRYLVRPRSEKRTIGGLLQWMVS
jgi:hypothetical protein